MYLLFFVGLFVYNFRKKGGGEQNVISWGGGAQGGHLPPPSLYVKKGPVDTIHSILDQRKFG